MTLTAKDKAKVREVFRYCEMRYFRNYRISVTRANQVFAYNVGTTSRAWFDAKESLSEARQYALLIHAEALRYVAKKLTKQGRSDIPDIELITKP